MPSSPPELALCRRLPRSMFSGIVRTARRSGPGNCRNQEGESDLCCRPPKPTIPRNCPSRAAAARIYAVESPTDDFAESSEPRRGRDQGESDLCCRVPRPTICRRR